MNPSDKVYHDLLDDILENGVKKGDRTGTGTTSVFGRMIKFNMRDGFPLLTTKKVWFKGVIHELLWFLQGGTNTKYLVDNKVNIWNEWAKEDGDLGPVYGKQWVDWEYNMPVTISEGHGIDNPWYEERTGTFKRKRINQIQNLIDRINNPDTVECRRLLVNAWNPGELDQMGLMPCHYSFQFISEPMDEFERFQYATMGGILSYEGDSPRSHEALDHAGIPSRRLSLLWNQRSVDTFLGLPFNIASYAALLHMVAQVTDHVPHELTGMLGDTHIYSNHPTQVKEQLSRSSFDLPQIRLNPEIDNIFDFKYEDFEILDYESHPTISAPIAV